MIVIANTSKSEFEKIKVKVPRLSNELFATPIKVSANIPTVSRGEISTNMSPLEVQVLVFQNLDVK